MRRRVRRDGGLNTIGRKAPGAPPREALIYAVVCLALLLCGFYAGRWISGGASASDAAAPVDIDEAEGVREPGDFRRGAVAEAALARLRAALAAEAERPLAKAAVGGPAPFLGGGDRFRGHVLGAEELATAAAEVLAALAAAFDPERRPTLEKALQLLRLAGLRVHEAMLSAAPLASQRVAAQAARPAPQPSVERRIEELVASEAYEDFRCDVKELPFGIEVGAEPGLAPTPGLEGFPVVRDVMPGSPADILGVRPGDALLQVGGAEASTDVWLRAQAPVALRILRRARGAAGQSPSP